MINTHMPILLDCGHLRIIKALNSDLASVSIPEPGQRWGECMSCWLDRVAREHKHAPLV